MPAASVENQAEHLPSSQIDRLATSYPFVYQVCVISTRSSLWKRPTRPPNSPSPNSARTLSASPFTTFFKAHHIQCDADDTWCILCVSKSLYERLGVVGKRIPLKGPGVRNSTMRRVLRWHWGLRRREDDISTAIIDQPSPDRPVDHRSKSKNQVP
ncbi:hypothetical protein JVU11DRAFT_6555 [Chiua virens]|nr:hypothetical protein JVU11DRAFT_6555 [Chiua virens]